MEMLPIDALPFSLGIGILPTLVVPPLDQVSDPIPEIPKTLKVPSSMEL
jgi:hypothetical protein